MSMYVYLYVYINQVFNTYLISLVHYITYIPIILVKNKYTANNDQRVSRK